MGVNALQAALICLTAEYVNDSIAVLLSDVLLGRFLPDVRTLRRVVCHFEGDVLMMVTGRGIPQYCPLLYHNDKDYVMDSDLATTASECRNALDIYLSSIMVAIIRINVLPESD